MIVIPKTNHRLGKAVFITERTQACRAQQKILASGSGTKPEPTGGKNANEVPTRKQQYI